MSKDTLWATQAQIAQLFEVNSQAVTKHLKNIYKEGELRRTSTCSKMEQVRIEGGRTIKRNIEYFNLDAIIAVGYRVNSKKATKFCIWATGVLRNYLINGFALDKKNLTVSTDKVENLHEAIEFIESTAKGGPLKASVTVRLKRDLMK
ncbi:MAG: virulence RhuM family protein [Patescibacteria group bacterium]|nr:virulence RhuM family protein [Patescibacteria group bacterium]